MLQTLSTSPKERLRQIEHTRRLVLHDGLAPDGRFASAWLADSWRRCLARGQRPEQRVAFDLLPKQTFKRVEEANHELVAAAAPVLERLGRAIANTRYFAILTNGDGIVVNVNGPIDRRDRRVDVIARVGVDLSEPSVGTTAISAALTELRPVWLHRGEHFFCDTSVYSCAGAPLFGPDGHCVGMLDLTGVDAVERPELKHLVAQSARSIENALTLRQRHSLLLRLNWPGRPLGEESDGLVGLDDEGYVTAANQAARAMVPQLSPAPIHSGSLRVHSRDLFALPVEMLFGSARQQDAGMEAPLWSGLRLNLQAQTAPRRSVVNNLPRTVESSPSAAPRGKSETLKDLENALICKAVDVARGNVSEAARSLGVSRATVYRKLARKRVVTSH